MTRKATLKTGVIALVLSSLAFNAHAVPDMPALSLYYGTKQLQFDWLAVDDVTHYRLLRSLDGETSFAQVGDDLPSSTFNATLDIAFYRDDWANARFYIEACNDTGCTASNILSSGLSPLDVIGYAKASNAQSEDAFGLKIALSADGSTMAVAADDEASGATGINGLETDNSAIYSGAVYVFRREAEGDWVQ